VKPQRLLESPGIVVITRCLEDSQCRVAVLFCESLPQQTPKIPQDLGLRRRLDIFPQPSSGNVVHGGVVKNNKGYSQNL
jgi:hypothetical protein